MNEIDEGSESSRLKARLKKIHRFVRYGNSWEASFLRRGIPRLEEDGSITYNFPPQVTPGFMEPFLSGLSDRVGFPIRGEYETISMTEARQNQAGDGITAGNFLEIEQHIRLGPLAPDTRLGAGVIPQRKPEPPVYSVPKKRAPVERSDRKRKERITQEGVPMDIKASASFRELSRNAQGILKVMYGLSHFDRSASRRTCGVSRSGLAKLQRVTPRTVTNAWNEMERRFLVLRLKRGDRCKGISVFELPYNYSQACLWRMEAGGKKRY
jgi:hypothetical protein